VADYCRLDLTCPVPGCGQHELRTLLLEGNLKLKDAYSKVQHALCSYPIKSVRL